MTLKEAKDILKKEFAVIDLHKSTEPFEFDESGWIEHEKPSVLEAFRVLAKEGYYVAISGHDYNMREKRLKKEYEENTKAPGSAENRIKEDSGVSPALKESASQFNDALLDEQAKEIESLRDKCKKYADILDSVGDKLRELKAENRRIKNSDLNLEGLAHATRELKEKDKKIVELTDENERLKDQVAVIYACKENNEKYNLKQIKRLGKEIAKLNSIIHDKNAVLADVAEELRLAKIREKNLTEVGQKYMKENEELKNELDAFKESYKRRIKEDSEHFEHIQKICNAGLQKWLLESEYLEKDKPFRLSNYDIARGKENKKPRIPTPEEPKHDNSREDFIKKAIDSFNIRAANLGSVGSKDGNGIIDQMIGVDIAEEGADLSGVIVLCGKDFIDALKKVKDVWQE